MTRVTGINGHLFLASYFPEPEVTLVVWRYSQIPLPALDKPSIRPHCASFEAHSLREDGAVINMELLPSKAGDIMARGKYELKSLLGKLVCLYYRMQNLLSLSTGFLFRKERGLK